MVSKNQNVVLSFLVLIIFAYTSPALAKKINSPKSLKFKCGTTQLEKSDCMIRTILEDMKTTYSHKGGGGITEIKALATNIYRVSIAQEERIDHITYEFEWKANGELSISKRSENTESFLQLRSGQRHKT